MAHTDRQDSLPFAVAQWQGRGIGAIVAFRDLAYGDYPGKRVALVRFYCGRSRIIDLAEIEVKSVEE